MVSVVTTSQSRNGSRRVFRNSFTAGLFAALLLFGTASCARYAFAGGPIGARVPLAVTAIVGVLLIIMMLRASIIVTDDQVTVRGWIRHRTAIWSDITGFGFAPANPLNRRTVYIEVRLNDGSRLHTPGLTAASKTGKFALRTIADMEALRPH
jgi:Bacterial PH domain